MTADQIIQEITSLPPEEQAKVVRFAYYLDAERQLTGKELASLAARMLAATDPVQATMLREEITRGFYGGKRSVSPHMSSRDFGKLAASAKDSYSGARNLSEREGFSS